MTHLQKMWKIKTYRAMIRQYTLLKYKSTSMRLHGATSQKTVSFCKLWLNNMYWHLSYPDDDHQIKRINETKHNPLKLFQILVYCPMRRLFSDITELRMKANMQT
jgi:hypothetical protein